MFKRSNLSKIPFYKNRMLTDVSLFLISCGAVIYLAEKYNWFEWFYHATRQHDNWQLDEWALLFINLTVAGVYFSFRNLRDVRREFAKRVEAEKRMEFLALNDPLTGLANRRLFNQVIENLLLQQKRSGVDFALIMLDLDRFKPINDLYGHATGDQVLQGVAKRLKAVLRNHECFARLGGDEFAIVLNNIETEDELARVATRILRALDEPFRIDNILCQTGVSLGIAISHADSPLHLEEFVKRADMALYRAKDEGRGQYRYFEEAMDEKVKERSRLELEMRRAITNKEIRPYYQPLVHLADGRIEGYELLARWQHPQDGLIPPDRFIPIAEDTGLIGEMSLMLLDQACEDARDWPVGTYIAINIAPVQLRDSLLCAKIMSVLRTHNFDPACLEIEITENALIYDLDMAKKVLCELKACGMSLSLDDFGTGYSSLHHLRELPFDKLKIDSSFIMSMNHSPESRKIVDAVIALSKSLGLKTTAEGIETEENAQWLTEIGCLTGQGYLYGKPVKAEDALRSVDNAPQVKVLRNMLTALKAEKLGKPYRLKAAPRQAGLGT